MAITFYSYAYNSSQVPCGFRTATGGITPVTTVGCDSSTYALNFSRCLLHPQQLNAEATIVTCVMTKDLGFATEQQTCALGKTSWVFDPVNDFITLKFFVYSSEDPHIIPEVIVERVSSSNIVQGTVLHATGLTYTVNNTGAHVITISENGLQTQASTSVNDWMRIRIFVKNTQAHASSTLQHYPAATATVTATIPLDVPIDVFGACNFNASSTVSATGSMLTSGAVHLHTFSRLKALVTKNALQVTDWRWETTDVLETAMQPLREAGQKFTAAAYRKNFNNSYYSPDADLNDLDYTIYDNITWTSPTDREIYLHKARLRVRFLVKNNSSSPISNFVPMIMKRDNYYNTTWRLLGESKELDSRGLTPIYGGPYLGLDLGPAISSYPQINVLCTYTSSSVSNYVGWAIKSTRKPYVNVCNPNSSGDDNETFTYNETTNLWESTSTVIPFNVAEGGAWYAAGYYNWDNDSNVLVKYDGGSSATYASSDGLNWTISTDKYHRVSTRERVCQTSDGTWWKAIETDNGTFGTSIDLYKWVTSAYVFEINIKASTSVFYTLADMVSLGSQGKLLIKYTYYSSPQGVVIAMYDGATLTTLPNASVWTAKSIYKDPVDNNNVVIVHDTYNTFARRLYRWNDSTQTFTLQTDIEDPYYQEVYALTNVSGAPGNKESVTNGIRLDSKIYANSTLFTSGWTANYNVIFPIKHLSHGYDKFFSYHGMYNMWVVGSLNSYSFVPLQVAVNDTTRIVTVVGAYAQKGSGSYQTPKRVVYNTSAYPYIDGAHTTQKLGSGSYLAVNNACLSFGFSNTALPTIAVGQEVEIVADLFIDYHYTWIGNPPFDIELKLACANSSIDEDTTMLPTCRIVIPVKTSGIVSFITSATVVANGTTELPTAQRACHMTGTATLSATPVLVGSFSAHFVGNSTLGVHERGPVLNLLDARFFDPMVSQSTETQITSYISEKHIGSFVYNKHQAYLLENISVNRLRLVLSNDTQASKTVFPKLQYRVANAASPTWTDVYSQTFDNLCETSRAFDTFTLSASLDFSLSTTYSPYHTQIHSFASTLVGSTLYIYMAVVDQNNVLGGNISVYQVNTATNAISLHSVVLEAPYANNTFGTNGCIHSSPTSGTLWVVDEIFGLTGHLYFAVFRYNGSSWDWINLGGDTNSYECFYKFAEDASNNIWLLYSRRGGNYLRVQKWNGTAFDAYIEYTQNYIDDLVAFSYSIDRSEFRILYTDNTNNQLRETTFDPVSQTFFGSSYLVYSGVSGTNTRTGDSIVDVNDACDYLSIHIDSPWCGLLQYLGCTKGNTYIGAGAYRTESANSLYQQGYVTFTSGNPYTTAVGIGYRDTGHSPYVNLYFPSGVIPNDKVYAPYKCSTDNIIYMVYPDISLNKLRVVRSSTLVPFENGDNATQKISTGTYLTTNKAFLTCSDAPMEEFTLTPGQKVEMSVEVVLPQAQLDLLYQHQDIEFRLLDINSAETIDQRGYYPTITFDYDMDIHGDSSLSGTCTLVANGTKSNLTGKYGQCAMSGTAAVSATWYVYEVKTASANFTIDTAASYTSVAPYKGALMLHNYSVFTMSNIVANVNHGAKVLLRGYSSFKPYTGEPERKGCP